MAKDQRPYAPVDVGLPTNRKLKGADVRAKWLYVSTLLWCAQQLNDGIFEPRIAVVVADVNPRYVKTLIDRDLWHEKGHACPGCPQPTDAAELVVHDYAVHNRSAERIRKLRRDRRMAGRRANHDRWEHPGTFEECEKCND
jgi:hypothetical protein